MAVLLKDLNQLEKFDPTTGKNVKIPGVYYRAHETRRHGVKFDVQHVIRQKFGKRLCVSVYWASEGVTEQDAIKKSELWRLNAKWNRQNPDKKPKPVCKADELEINTNIAEEQRQRELAEREAQKIEEARLANRPTFSRLWSDYVETHLKDKASFVADRSRFKYLACIADKIPEELLPLDIERVKKGLKGQSKQQIKHVMILIKRLVNYGLNAGKCGPLRFKIQIPRPENEVTEYLEPDQLQALLTAIDKDLQKTQLKDGKPVDPFTGRAMLLALSTGMRRSEMLRLKWDDVNFTFGFIELNETKSGKKHRIPINEAAQEIFEAIPKTKSPYVFPGEPKIDEQGKTVYPQRADFNRGTRRISKAAGLPDGFRPLHGLRHHFASTLANSGEVDLYTLQRLMTHADPKTTERYAHLTDKRLKQCSGIANDIVKRRQSAKVVHLEPER